MKLVNSDNFNTLSIGDEVKIVLYENIGVSVNIRGIIKRINMDSNTIYLKDGSYYWFNGIKEGRRVLHNFPNLPICFDNKKNKFYLDWLTFN